MSPFSFPFYLYRDGHDIALVIFSSDYQACLCCGESNAMMAHVSSCILFLHSLSVVHIHPDEINPVWIILACSAFSLLFLYFIVVASKRSLVYVDRAFHYALYEADSRLISLGSIVSFTVTGPGNSTELEIVLVEACEGYVALSEPGGRSGAVVVSPAPSLGGSDCNVRQLFGSVLPTDAEAKMLSPDRQTVNYQARARQEVTILRHFTPFHLQPLQRAQTCLARQQAATLPAEN